MPNAPRDGSCNTVTSTSSRRLPRRDKACRIASSTLLPLASMLSTISLPPFIFIVDLLPLMGKEVRGLPSRPSSCAMHSSWEHCCYCDAVLRRYDVVQMIRYFHIRSSLICV